MTRRLTCDGCGCCCRHIAVEIDRPNSKDEKDAIEWYLLHEDVMVFVDYENKWYVEFAARCKALGKDNKCKVYRRRPEICRDYDPEECIRGKSEDGEKYSFKTRDEFLTFLKERKRKNRLKRKKR